MPAIGSLKEIKKGSVILFRDEPHVVLEAKFLRMQQRKPTMQTKLRNLLSGKTLDYNFNQGENLETAEVNRKPASFLYRDGNGFVFMDSKTYDQISLEDEVVANRKNYLKESLEVSLVYWGDRLISLDLPPKVKLEVTETEPGVRGDTAQGAVLKPATLETGYVLNVPLFVKQGDIIKVNTETGEYVERVS